MIRFLQIYFAFFKQQIKSVVEYRLDFVMGMIGLFTKNAAAFILMIAVFTNITNLAGYSFNEILFFYGYAQIVRGIDHIYNDNIWLVGWEHVQSGRFALYLVRPINPILHIVMEKVQFDGIGELVIGIIFFVYAKSKLALTFGPTGCLALALFTLSGLAIFFAIKLAFAAIAFWTVSSGETMTLAYEVNSFTRYPLDIYKNAALRFALLYLLPFAVVGYLPIVYFLRSPEFISDVIGVSYLSKLFLPILSMVIAAVSLVVSLWIWNMGLKRYEGSAT